MGDLYGFLRRKGIRADYTGVDILKEMVGLAAKRYPRGRFLRGDPLSEKIFPNKSFDVVYASGVFNLETGDNERFIAKAMRRLCELSAGSAAVSLLHRHSPHMEKQYHYYSPEAIVRIVERIPAAIKRIEIIEHYLKNDFTVVCEK